MKCWIVTVGEPIPINGRPERLLRSGILASTLAESGHSVVWWTTSFDHWTKTHRTDGHASHRTTANHTIVLLHGPGYRRNISFGRVHDHRCIASAFAKLAADAPRPDVILASLPTLELSAEAVAYGHATTVPVVIDVRDMWPDVMVRAAPGVFRPAARLATAGMRSLAKRACRGASAITGHAPAFVEWGLRHAGRRRTEWDRDFPFGYSRLTSPRETVKECARRAWESRGIRRDDRLLTVCFAGTIGHSFDFDPVVEAARALESEGVRFILCGTGDRFDELRRKTALNSNIVLAGWVQRPELECLLAISDVGLAPYRDEFDFRASIPNKAPEYLSAGLPIALSLPTGLLRGILDQRSCGFSYHGSTAQLADALRRLQRDRSLLARMKAAAERVFAERFRAEEVYASMAGYLEAIAHEGPRIAVT